ncbi:MAG: hypothetical protein ACKV2T_33810 [Kofleriaceae bacterium]
MTKLLVGLPIAVIVLVIALMATPFLSQCGGADEAVTSVVRRCDLATKYLGGDARPARAGLACGSTEISGDEGTASWSVPYTGENNRGTVSYKAVKVNDEWNVVAATLDADGQKIDLVACAGGSVNSLQKLDGSFDGKVTSSTHEQVKVDMVCKGTLSRKTGETLADVVATCADTADAGEGTVVYRGRAEVKADMGSSAKGDETLEYNDTKGPVNATLKFEGTTGSLRVWSQSPAWEIVVAL